MKISTWRNVTWHVGNSSQPVEDIVDFLTEEFGNITRNPVSKGDNDGWYMDQKIIRILIQKWIDSDVDRGKKIVYLPRKTRKDRIDRSDWPDPDDVDASYKVDAHLLDNVFMPEEWLKTKALLKKLISKDTYEWCMKYHAEFSRRLIDMRDLESAMKRYS